MQAEDKNADADAALQANLKCFALEEKKQTLEKELTNLKIAFQKQTDLFKIKQLELEKQLEDYKIRCQSPAVEIAHKHMLENFKLEEKQLVFQNRPILCKNIGGLYR